MKKISANTINSAANLITCATVADGDCGWHAIFGLPQPESRAYTDVDVHDRKRIFAERLANLTTPDNRTYQCAAYAIGQYILDDANTIDRAAYPNLSAIAATYKAQQQTDSFFVGLANLKCEKILNEAQNEELLTEINNIVPADKRHDKALNNLMWCCNELKGAALDDFDNKLKSKTDFYTEYKNFLDLNEQYNKKFSLDNRTLKIMSLMQIHGNALEEYGALLQNGLWLSPADIMLIAKVFDIQIDYYLKLESGLRHSEVFSGSSDDPKTKCKIAFTGSQKIQGTHRYHYERVLSKAEHRKVFPLTSRNTLRKQSNSNLPESITDSHNVNLTLAHASIDTQSELKHNAMQTNSKAATGQPRWKPFTELHKLSYPGKLSFFDLFTKIEVMPLKDKQALSKIIITKYREEMAQHNITVADLMTFLDYQFRARGILVYNALINRIPPEALLIIDEIGKLANLLSAFIESKVSCERGILFNLDFLIPDLARWPHIFEAPTVIGVPSDEIMAQVRNKNLSSCRLMICPFHSTIHAVHLYEAGDASIFYVIHHIMINLLVSMKRGGTLRSYFPEPHAEKSLQIQNDDSWIFHCYVRDYLFNNTALAQIVNSDDTVSPWQLLVEPKNDGQGKISTKSECKTFEPALIYGNQFTQDATQAKLLVHKFQMMKQLQVFMDVPANIIMESQVQQICQAYQNIPSAPALAAEANDGEQPQEHEDYSNSKRLNQS